MPGGSSDTPHVPPPFPAFLLLPPSASAHSPCRPALRCVSVSKLACLLSAWYGSRSSAMRDGSLQGPMSGLRCCHWRAMLGVLVRWRGLLGAEEEAGRGLGGAMP